MSITKLLAPPMAAILLTMGLASCTPVDRDEVFDVEEPIERVVIQLDHGDLTIIGSDRDDVLVERSVQGWKGSIDLETRVEDDTLTLRAGCEGPMRCDVNMVIEVPAGVEVSVQSGEGDVELVDLTGVVDVVVSDGDLDTRGLEKAELYSHRG
ncbi:MAG: hypothetical protein GY913_02360 [Proteobacteria bacterium]|nr:hypothetical protein [Pseudomonadota bacterium]MCP4915743.1 hypothetical protein [Pseudomonadota bacterium]